MEEEKKDLGHESENDALKQSNLVQEETGKKPQQVEEKKYTDSDIDAIINEKFKKWSKDKEKEVDEAKKLAEMTAQEKAEYERDGIRKELEGYKEKIALSDMSKTARGILSDSGIVIKEELLSMLVVSDAQKTKDNINGFINLFKEAVDTNVRDVLKDDVPKKGKNVSKLTKSEIMAIADNEERRKKIAENLELFE